MRVLIAQRWAGSFSKSRDDYRRRRAGALRFKLKSNRKGVV